MMRQICKQVLTIERLKRLFLVLLTGFLLVAPTLLPAWARSSALQRQIVTDPLSGVAINGYDPVSYFTDAEPLLGRSEFELIWKGVPWFFVSAANRDVFRRSPQIYAPQFGGYGLMGLSRGYLSDGNPRIYAILAQRLFLFHSTSNRDAFLLSQQSAYRKAANNWTILSVDL